MYLSLFFALTRRDHSRSAVRAVRQVSVRLLLKANPSAVSPALPVLLEKSATPAVSTVD